MSLVIVIGWKRVSANSSVANLPFSRRIQMLKKVFCRNAMARFEHFIFTTWTTTSTTTSTKQKFVFIWRDERREASLMLLLQETEHEVGSEYFMMRLITHSRPQYGLPPTDGTTEWRNGGGRDGSKNNDSYFFYHCRQLDENRFGRM